MLEDIKGVFFDMDGTLLNTLDDICGSINETLTAWGLPNKTTAELLRYIGYGAKHLCRGATGFEEGEKLDAFHKAYRQNSLNRNDPKTVAYEGIPETVARLKRKGVRVGIYTNKPQAWTEKLAARYFGTDVFDGIYGVHEGGVLKPSAVGIEEMCASWGIDISKTVMVGDSPVDIETAHHAGICGIGCTWGFRSEAQLVEAGADRIAHHAGELMALLHVSDADMATI